ncbi:MAG: sporulation protein YabP [Oscillospiraceae bacterium]
MAYSGELVRQEVPHHIILENRHTLAVSGVEDVESFDESAVVMHTAQGILVVRGGGLHIEKLSLDGGDMRIEGEVSSLTYEEDTRVTGGFLARLFR